MLPRGEATKVKCQIHFGSVPEGMPMIFELEEDIKRLDRLELGGELTKITAGISSHVTSLVSNNTDRNIFLKRRTKLVEYTWLSQFYQLKSPQPNLHSRRGETSFQSYLTSRSRTRWMGATGRHESARRKLAIDFPRNATTRSWCLCKSLRWCWLLKIWSLKSS